MVGATTQAGCLTRRSALRLAAGAACALALASMAPVTAHALPSSQVTPDPHAEDAAWLAVQMAATATPEAAIGTLGEPGGPLGAWYRLADSRLDNEYAVYDATLAAWGGSTAYASCTQAVCAALGATLDTECCTEWPSKNSENFYEYIQRRTDIYTEVTGAGIGDLMPGDVLVTTWHTAMFVGNELAREKFPNTNGNMYEAFYHGRKYPAISLWTGVNGFRVFRPTARGADGVGGRYYPDYESLVNSSRGGRVSITKRAQGGQDGDGPFACTLTVTDPSGTTTTERAALHVGETWTSTHHPDGSTYRVSETAMPDGWGLVSITPSSGTIRKGETAQVEVLNTRLGKIRIEKGLELPWKSA